MLELLLMLLGVLDVDALGDPSLDGFPTPPRLTDLDADGYPTPPR